MLTKRHTQRPSCPSMPRRASIAVATHKQQQRSPMHTHTHIRTHTHANATPPQAHTHRAKKVCRPADPSALSRYIMVLTGAVGPFNFASKSTMRACILAVESARSIIRTYTRRLRYTAALVATRHRHRYR